MVQIVENWSDVRGRVEAVERTSEGATPLALQLRVLVADSVAGFPNLLAESVGDVIAVRGPDIARMPQVGQLIRCRVRKAGLHQCFYAPDTLIVE